MNKKSIVICLNCLWADAYNIDFLDNPVKNKKMYMINTKKDSFKQYVVRLLVIFLVFPMLSACVKVEENRGYVKGASVNVERIKIGVTDKNDVRYLLGSPSSISTFGGEIWYYIGLTMHRASFLKPDVVDQNILIVSFDESGIVEDITQKGAEDRRNIEISEEATPTEGNRLTIMDQLLGNLGRYNAPD